MGSKPEKFLRLIVNADDFGASEEVNEAIIRAHREGVLTSCSLMVSGKAFEQAVALAKENSRLAVGLHLVVVMGRSVLPSAAIPNLVDRQGCFSNSPVAAGLNYFFSRQAQLELEKELTAQFERFQSTQLPFSHIDGHLHMHTHPVVFKLAMRLGIQFGVQRMRVPEEELGLALRYGFGHFPRKILHGLLFHWLSRRMKRRLKEESFLFSDRVYGTLQTGEVTRDYLLFLLSHLNSDSNEIHCHPAFFQSASLNFREQCQLTEFEALTDRKVRDFLNSSTIQLTNYFGLDSCP
ncbi:MAG: hopanoid biosynthesis-associated protein HpnK [Terriglobia bacterium]